MERLHSQRSSSVLPLYAPQIPAYTASRRRSGRVVECTGLENRRGGNSTVGSNPTSSATLEPHFSSTRIAVAQGRCSLEAPPFSGW
jgi:hypothetical protein